MTTTPASRRVLLGLRCLLAVMSFARADDADKGVAAAAKDFAELSRTKLTMPVLSIGGDKSLGRELGDQAKLVGTDVTVVVLKDAGHWILEEQPAATTAALVKFL